MRSVVTALAAMLCLIPYLGSCQTDSSTLGKITGFPQKLFKKIRTKADETNQQLSSKTQQYLARLSKDEARLKGQFQKMDSAKAASLFASDPQQAYAAWQQKMRSDTAQLATLKGGQYLNNLDTLHASLAFLKANPGAQSSLA